MGSWFKAVARWALMLLLQIQECDQVSLHFHCQTDGSVLVSMIKLFATGLVRAICPSLYSKNLNPMTDLTPQSMRAPNNAMFLQDQ